MRPLILLLFSACYLSAFAQRINTTAYAAHYDFVAVTDTIEKDYTQPREFLLLHANGISHFHTLSRHFNDSMSHVYTVANPAISTARTQEEAQEAINAYQKESATWRKKEFNEYRVRKDFTGGNTQLDFTFVRFPPKHLSTTLNQQWKISDRQRKIAGLNCYAATTQYGGRHYTAWYAPSIPIPDGPYVFAGLPGLIVEISDDRDWFLFRLTSLNTQPQLRHWETPYLNPSSQAIDRATFTKMARKQKEQPTLVGISNPSPEQLLGLKKQYAWRYYMLFEQ